ncbi:actin-domain-containing protein [Geopyxis carbonaria]|nr:actin-domain-containing protein [Geopyxis carbonaria]
MAPNFRDDHILIIAPGSVHTLAQLGLPESFTPPRVRIQSRMFPGIEEGTWTATKIREAHDGEKAELIAKAGGAAGEDEGDDDDEGDGEGEGEGEDGGDGEGEGEGDGGEGGEGEEGGEGVYVEDEEDEEGAVWCMREGKVVNWGCFFALLQYVHETINPTFHTPILLVHPPGFSGDDKEKVTQFIFEKLKVPAFALLDASLAGLWAYGLQTATVIDVGHEKTDITPIIDFLIQDRARRTVRQCGGDTMTQHLHSLLPELKPEDVEQLKKSPVCEILPVGMPLPGEGGPVRSTSEAASAEDKDIDMLGEDEGTINVAAIVASGKTQEFLAQKEKERRGEEERRKPNREREINYFWIVDKKRPGEVDQPASALTSPVVAHGPGFPAPADAPAAGEAAPAPAAEPAAPVVTTDVIAPQDPAPPSDPSAAPAPLTVTVPPTTAPTTDDTSPLPETSEESEQRYKAASKRAQERRAAADGIVLKPDETWRELAIGSARFRAAHCGILSRIADELFAAISSVEDVAQRPALWENLVLLGNGARIRGFKEALLQTIVGKYLIPPSTGTIFSSELPTPSATGASTPVPGHGGASGVTPNPLLVAATAHAGGHGGHGHHGHAHSQSPMAIRYAKMPDYFPEWKEAGFDEAAFLGAQVAAKVVFVVDQGLTGGFMTRVMYNEVGPGGWGEMNL